MKSEVQNQLRAELQSILDQPSDAPEVLINAYAAYAMSLTQPPYDFEAAMEPAGKAIQLAEAILSKGEGSEELAYTLSDCYRCTVMCLVNLKRSQEAVSYTQKDLRLLRDLAKNSGAITSIYCCALAHDYTAELFSVSGDREEELRHRRAAAHLMDALLEGYGVNDFPLLTARMYQDYAVALKGDALFNDASIEAYRKCIDLLEALPLADRSEETAKLLSEACRGIAGQLDQRGDHTEADTRYKQSFEVLEPYIDPDQQEGFDFIKQVLQDMIDRDIEDEQ